MDFDSKVITYQDVKNNPALLMYTPFKLDEYNVYAHLRTALNRGGKDSFIDKKVIDELISENTNASDVLAYYLSQMKTDENYRLIDNQQIVDSYIKWAGDDNCQEAKMNKQYHKNLLRYMRFNHKTKQFQYDKLVTKNNFLYDVMAEYYEDMHDTNLFDCYARFYEGDELNFNIEMHMLMVGEW